MKKEEQLSTKHRKIKIEQHEPTTNRDELSYAPEG